MSCFAPKTASAADDQGTYNPIAPVGIIVDVGCLKIDIAAAEAFRSSLSYLILASPNCLIGCELAAFTIAVTTAIAALPVVIPRIASTPGDLKGIPFSASAGILNANHRYSIVARITNQLLPSAPVDSSELEVCCICRDSFRALEPAPLRRLARNIAQSSRVTAELDVCRPINDNFHGALSAVV
jgi:hypothetical protein